LGQNLHGSDNGTEFIGGSFSDILIQYGVTQWRTTPQTLEQIGKMERFWRTIDKSSYGKSDLSLIQRTIL
jgi:transposase InsO family protein